MRIANRAAGIVVGKLGTAVAPRELELHGRRTHQARAIMYYVVTGAAGFIGSNLVEAPEPRAA